LLCGRGSCGGGGDGQPLLLVVFFLAKPASSDASNWAAPASTAAVAFLSAGILALF